MTIQTLAVPSPAVSVTLEPTGFAFVANIDDLSQGNVCSCAAGDDNPF